MKYSLLIFISIAYVTPLASQTLKDKIDAQEALYFHQPSKVRIFNIVERYPETYINYDDVVGKNYTIGQQFVLFNEREPTSQKAADVIYYGELPESLLKWINYQMFQIMQSYFHNLKVTPGDFPDRSKDYYYVKADIKRYVSDNLFTNLSYDSFNNENKLLFNFELHLTLFQHKAKSNYEKTIITRMVNVKNEIVIDRSRMTSPSLDGTDEILQNLSILPEEYFEKLKGKIDKPLLKKLTK